MVRFELGPSIFFREVADIQHEFVGIALEHHTSTGERCACLLFFDLPGVCELHPDEPLYCVCSWEPLTLAPAVLCPLCGLHGRIRNDRWEPHAHL